MPTRTSRKTNDAQLAFEALSIEGGLLSPEWLSKVAQLGASHQSEADYGIRKGLSLRDELGRYWRIAQAEWAEFDSGRRGGGNALELAVKFAQTLLKECFGFASLGPATPVTIADRLYPLRFHAVGGRVPIVVAPAGSGLDTPSADFGDGTRKRSAFGLTQEYLNAEEKAVWGIATDGLSLRIVRDNASLTRPAWIEVDLARLFVEARYADFTALWLLMHESRFGREGQAPTECALEQWRTAGREQGTRARALLRDGVQDALVALGQGFLSQRDNQALRDGLKNGSLTERAYFQQLLRLVYRLIFLITAEERDLLFAPDAPDAAKQLYAEGYGLRRLRERSAKRRAHDRFTDLYTGLRIVFRGLEAGQPVLGLPALAGLFSAGQTPALDGANLENHSLLEAVFRLSWIRDGASLSRVNWRDMGPEELGSVYESLLELVPVLTDEGRVFGFATADESKGNARKTTGSYYTADSLVQVLLDGALEPVVQRTIATNPVGPVDALLKLSIVDPACGSGHFLLGAARRLAAHVARLEANGTPSPKEYRHALRRVVGQCVFGVDLNPMAIELCRLALWMEAVDPGKPLSFLDSHLQQGNALLGTTPELLKNGIPDEAWVAIEGDDSETAAALKRRNKEERLQTSLDLAPARSAASELAAAASELDSASDTDAESLERKARHWHELTCSATFRHQWLVADTWCSAFVWPKPQTPSPLAESAPTNATWRQVRDTPSSAPAVTLRTVERLRKQYEFFHWHLAFPQIFARGGFDVVIGNPPWETLSPDAKEFFAAHNPLIREAKKSEQEAIVSSLLETPAIAEEWTRHRRELYSKAHFLKKSGAFSLFAPGNLGKGDFDLYRLFIERALQITALGGYAAQVVKSGIYNGANAQAIRKSLFENWSLDLLIGFVNTGKHWFPSVHAETRFALYAARKGGVTRAVPCAFGVDTDARLKDSLAALGSIPLEAIVAQSPSTLAIPETDGESDLALTSKMHARWPAFGDATAGPPFRHYQREIDMGTDRDRFSESEGLPLYEGRMVDRYDHRAKAYRSGRGRSAVWEPLVFGDPRKAIVPQWKVLREHIPEKLGDRTSQFRIVWCDVATPTADRSLAATIVPPGVICGDTTPTLRFEPGLEWAYLPWLAIANSFCADFLVRKKIALHIKYVHLDSLPFPRPQPDDAWVRRVSPLVLKLVCTAPEMADFWNMMSLRGLCDPIPKGTVPKTAFVTESSRELARAELDAIVAHDVYGLSRTDLVALLNTFIALRRAEEKAHGEYRTQRVILEIYDAMAAASKSGTPYHTVLSPPRADATLAHPDTRKVKR